MPANKIITAVAIVLALLLLAALAPGWLHAGLPLETAANSASDAAAVLPAQLATVRDLQRVEAESASTTKTAAQAAASFRRGTVFDCRGHPVPNVPLRLCAFDARTIGDVVAGSDGVSGTDGAFLLPSPVERPVLAMAGAGFVTLRTMPSSRSPDGTDLQVVVAPEQVMRGFVHDEQGAPVADVRVSGWSFLLPEFPRPLEGTIYPQASSPPSATTSTDGRFTLAAVAVGPGLSLTCTRDGYRQERVATLQVQRGFVDVTLHKERAGAGTVSGIVIDACGRPVELAQLRYGNRQVTRSAADGSFRFELEKCSLRLLALHAGYQPIVRDDVGADTPMPLQLQFTQPCLEIRGRVVDGRGAPLVGVLVNLVDPARAGGNGSIEKLSASAPEAGLPPGARARTDADGAFTITGLSARSYRVRAWDEVTALSAASEPVPAGSRDVLLVLSDNAFVAELHGRVVTRDGAGVAGVMVSSQLLVDRFDFVMVRGPKANTNADGRFVLQKVPARFLQLSVNCDDYEYATAPVEDCLRQGEARIVVLRKCYVQIEARAGLEVQFLDADAKVLTVSVDSMGMAMLADGWKLREAKSPVMTVSETAVTMTWLQDGKELGRKRINLQPGKQHVNALTADL